MCMRVEYFTAAKLFTYYPKMKTALYNITFQDSSGPITAATATTRITASFTKLEEIGTTTKARTGLIQHAAGGFQTILQLQPLPKRTTRAANAREIAKGTFSETCASTKAKNLSKPRATTMIFLELVSFEMQLKVLPMTSTNSNAEIRVKEKIDRHIHKERERETLEICATLVVVDARTGRGEFANVHVKSLVFR